MHLINVQIIWNRKKTLSMKKTFSRNIVYLLLVDRKEVEHSKWVNTTQEALNFIKKHPEHQKDYEYYKLNSEQDKQEIVIDRFKVLYHLIYFFLLYLCFFTRRICFVTNRENKFALTECT